MAGNYNYRTYVRIDSDTLRAYIRFKKSSVMRLAADMGCSESMIHTGLHSGRMTLELVLAISNELATPTDAFSTVHRDGNKITFERIEKDEVS